MKKIYLCCSAGMSTSMLAKKIKEAADKRGLDFEVEAVSTAAFDEVIQTADVCLLGPQVKYNLEGFQKKAAELNKKVDVIDSISYGMMNGEKVLDQALSLMEP